MRYRLLGLLIGLIVLAGCGVPQASGPVAQESSVPPASQAATTAPASPEATRAPEPTLESKSAPTLVPTDAPVATATAAPAGQKTITIDQPAAAASVTSPVTIKGSANFWPFEATLGSRIKDASGNVLGAGPVMVNAPDAGQGGPFEGHLQFTPPSEAQDGTLEVFEASAKDGSIVVMQSVKVRLPAAATTSSFQLDAPTEGQAVTLPLHIALRGAQPDEALTARLRFSNGAVLEQSPLPIEASANGVGYVVYNLNWNTESAPPSQPGDATFEIAGAGGTLIKRVNVRVLPDSETQLVDVAWVSPGDAPQLIVMKQAVPKTPQIGTAALQELLNGPSEGNAAGAITALPSLKEIVTFPGRTADWGYEVKLIKLTINNGVATANFSKELKAYGGGSARVQAIRQQIERTLKQFPTVQQVVIQIEGQSEGVLEP